MSKILRIFACLFALFFVVDASGAGYTCSASSKKYTSCKSGYYMYGGTGAGNSCKKCPTGYPNSAGGTGGITTCYSNTKSRAWTGSQVNGSVPSGCASVTAWNACSKPACNYVAYSNSAGTGDGTIKSGCSSNSASCTKTPKTVTASTNRYVSGTSCPTCSSYSSTYTKSDGGSISSAYCYRTATKTGSQVNGSVPSGCASVTAWNACTPGTCTYKDYLGQTGETCTPSNCTKTPKTVTASTSHYVSGTSCPTCPSGYTSANGTTGGIGSCYINVSAGNYIKTANSSTQSTCTAGYWNPAHTVYYGNTSSCNKCTGATYSDTDGASSCKQCPTATEYADIITSYWYWSEDDIHDTIGGCRAEFDESDSKGSYNYSCSYKNGDYGVAGGGTDTCMATKPNSCAATYYWPGGDSNIWAGNRAELLTQMCSSVGKGYWSAAGSLTRSQCPANYRDGAAAGSQNNCIGIFEKTGGQNNPTKPTGCATMEYASSCTPPTCEYQKNYAGTVVKDCTPGNCTKAITKLTANADRYVNGTTSCPACSSYSSTYTKSDGGSITYNSCYITRSKTGSQVNGSTPSGCASVTAWNACTPGKCTYKDYLGQTGETCTPSNCTKTPKTVTAKENYYVSGTSCPTCSSYSSTYTKSDGGSISSAYCYRTATKTGSQVNGSVPSGCASVTAWNACTPGTCTYKDYASATDTTCTPSNCTKTPKTVTAKENYYVSGATCPACSSYSSTYTKSDGGSISSAYCYRTATKTGSQVNGSTPSGCASVTAWNACTPGTCTYKDYASATDTTCTPTNCTKTVAAVAAKSGYYDDGTTCPACPTAYPNSAANNEGGIAKCYMSVSGGKYVAKANATSVSTCAAGTYKAAHSVYYGSTSSCSVCGNNSYSNAGAASCTACATDYSNSGTAAASHAGASSCKISCDAGTRVASANAGCTTPSGNWYVGAHTVSQGSISSVNSCLTNYVITGTSPSNHDASSDCKITCAGGSYIAAANNTSCTKVGAGYWAAASVVPQGSTGVRNACESGMTTIGFGAGADESGDCGRVLNIGDEKIYLRSTKKTSPSLNISINGDVFYGSMSTAHAGSSLKINSGGTRYSVYDDSNPPLEHTGGNAND